MDKQVLIMLMQALYYTGWPWVIDTYHLGVFRLYVPHPNSDFIHPRPTSTSLAVHIIVKSCTGLRWNNANRDCNILLNCNLNVSFAPLAKHLTNNPVTVKDLLEDMHAI